MTGPSVTGPGATGPGAIDLSVVIPAYNEAGRIGPTLHRLLATLERLPLPWEIVVADDGSADDTAAIVAAVSAREPRVRCLRLPHRGKGAAVRDGLLAAQGGRRFLCDADLAMPPAQITRFLAVLPSQCDIAIGSREGTGAVRVGEPLRRHLLGRVFNMLVRAMVLPGIQDTQCGFKLFTAAAAEAVLPTTAIEGWAFDVELLASARAQGWRVLEVPIEWHFGQASKLRVVPHSIQMLRDLYRVRAKVRRGAFTRRPSVPHS
ncbi:MAG: dolichyl-phosphate beta-glucosyltransferase [Vicinamibacteraceae bacterium]